MKYEIVNLEEKILVGIGTKTSNSDPKSGEVIGGLWNKMFSEGIVAKIKNKSSEHPLCLYSDYVTTEVSAEKLEYDVTIGFGTTTNENPEYKEKIISAGKYAKFSIKGNMISATAEAWQKNLGNDTAKELYWRF